MNRARPITRHWDNYQRPRPITKRQRDQLLLLDPKLTDEELSRLTSHTAVQRIAQLVESRSA